MNTFAKNNTQPKPRTKPSANDIENSVLGAILTEREVINNIFGELNKDLFYENKNRIIYDAIVYLFCNSKPIDVRTVNKQVQAMGLSEQVSANYILALGYEVITSSSIDTYIRILKEYATRRHLITLAEEALKDAFDMQKDVFEVLEKADTDLVKITNDTFGQDSFTAMDDAVIQAIDKAQLAYQNGGTLTLSSGVEAWDKIIGGFFAGELSIVAGRPSMGKTTVAMHLLRTIAMSQRNVGFMSLEMSTESLANKEIITEFHRHDPNCTLDVIRLRMGKVSPQENDMLTHVKENVNQYLHRIKVSQKSSMTLGGIKSKAKELVRKHDIKILVIDYLQLIGDDQSRKNDNRNLEIERIANGLKTLSKELSIPIIALAQLNRGVENRTSKIPQLSDLRDSGGLEQAADNITFLYRPEYYEILQDDAGNSTAGLLELVVAKNRNGQTGKASSQINLKAGTMQPQNVDFSFLEKAKNKNNAPVSTPQTEGEKGDDLPF
jgi:replicative DNA helicase